MGRLMGVHHGFQLASEKRRSTFFQRKKNDDLFPSSLKPEWGWSPMGLGVNGVGSQWG